jgi:hypothetical protein
MDHSFSEEEIQRRIEDKRKKFMLNAQMALESEGKGKEHQADPNKSKRQVEDVNNLLDEFNNVFKDLDDRSGERKPDLEPHKPVIHKKQYEPRNEHSGYPAGDKAREEANSSDNEGEEDRDYEE